MGAFRRRQTVGLTQSGEKNETKNSHVKQEY